MVHVRVAELRELQQIADELKRKGEELTGYGMFGYGPSIVDKAKRIKEICINARD